MNKQSNNQKKKNKKKPTHINYKTLHLGFLT